MSVTIWQRYFQSAPVSISSELFHRRARGSILSDRWQQQQQQRRRGRGNWGANSDPVATGHFTGSGDDEVTSSAPEPFFGFHSIRILI